nr:MAG TPA: hypothetical protein [Caudoviricetes sp.]DAZ83874.1 MAG TPA: hypothetical protein [Caudoviricetes sp.]
MRYPSCPVGQAPFPWLPASAKGTASTADAG